MIEISPHIEIKQQELTIRSIRSQGPGGQNVNKVATAIHLSFSIKDSTLPASYKQKLLAVKDKRLSQNGIMIIKAQSYRSREKNLKDACERLKNWVIESVKTPKNRRPTRATKGAIERRLNHKKQHSKLKNSRKKISSDD